MNITHRVENDIYIFKLDRVFSADKVAQILDYVQPFIDDEKVLKIIFNLKEVDHIDSIGIGCIVELQQTLHKRKGKLAFCETNEYILDILDVTNVDTLVTLHQTEAEAIAHFS